MIKSPLNYTGGKFKLLPQLLPLFPREDEYTSFVDLFCGGCNVAVNIKNKKVIANDSLPQLIDLYKYFQEVGSQQVYSDIFHAIMKYDLNKENKDSYLKLRADYNKTKDIKLLYPLICHSFSNQIRFNNKQEFNLPFGDRYFNPSLESRLSLFIDAIRDVEFKNQDFGHVQIPDGSMVYADPPYLITTATYNERNGWTEEQERCLLNGLSILGKRGIKFGLSNVLEHKGKENTILKEWAKQYNVHYLNNSYANCNYQTKNKTAKTVEVFITNYKTESK